MALDVGFAYHDDRRSVPVAKVAVVVSTVSDGNDWKQKKKDQDSRPHIGFFIVIITSYN